MDEIDFTKVIDTDYEPVFENDDDVNFDNMISNETDFDFNQMTEPNKKKATKPKGLTKEQKKKRNKIVKASRRRNRH